MTGRTPLWTSAEAEKATGGRATRAWSAEGVSIDSRTLVPGDLFVAIQGPNFDGHTFVADAVRKGAAAAVVSRRPEGVAEDAPLLLVADPFTALQDLARAARERTAARIVAVTGSVGKTGTKEALRFVLSAQGLTTASEGSLNNHWGVPLSLARMPRNAAYGVFELGMNHAGEIAPLTRMVRPHVAIVTTIEAVHLEFFDSVDDIAAAKAEIFDGLTDGGVAVLNQDNIYFGYLTRQALARGVARVVGFGVSPGAWARLVTYRQLGGASQLNAEIAGRPLTYRLGLPGRHLALNSLAVLAAVSHLGGDVAAAASLLGDLAPTKGRGARYELALPDFGRDANYTLVDESYNASPPAMRAAFTVLAGIEPGLGGRRIAVLGDMLELGAESSVIHRELAQDLVATGIDLVCTSGVNMVNLSAALPREMQACHTDRAEELLPLVRALIRPGDVVMVKGSHGSRMGLIVDALLADAATPRSAANGN
jgi:UDP-N-acetylmuramoyl-tripeptide--D-alanyl-D-alanine ligase